MRAKEGIGAGEDDIAGERLPECDDRKRAREEPGGGGRRCEGDDRDKLLVKRSSAVDYWEGES